MHLHSLTLRAIGPFPGEHRIDFAELGASGIFLLEGPTGAGKSTVIDAVVFALYGKVASEAASEDRLRSAYATDDVESFVDIVFETGSGVYRVRRTPEFRRAKKRGTGTTTQQAGVRMWRLATVPEPPRPGADEEPHGELVSARLDEAGAEIQRAVGLDRRQFVQTVVLPQGEFASFLRADPEQRRGLLQKVFGTEVYERVQAQLADLQRTAQKSVSTARAAVTGAVEHFCGAAGLATDTAETLRSADDEAAADLARTHIAQLAAAADDLAARELAANAALVAARADLDAARELESATARRNALRVEQAVLVERAPEVRADVGRLDAARRATVVGPALDGVRAAERALAAAQEARMLARTGVPGRLVDSDVSALEAIRSDVAAATVRLERLRPIGAELPAQERELVDARKDLARDQEERARLAADLAERPAARTALAAQIAELTQVAGELPLHQERVLSAEAVLTAARHVDSTLVELTEARGRRDAAVRTATTAVDTERAVRTARINGIAGEIATGLVNGDPCPVCGSADHPAPAVVTPDHVSSEDVEAAEQVRAAAEETLQVAGAAVHTLTERLEAHRRAAGGVDSAAAAERVAQAREAVDVAQRAATERRAAATLLADHDLETATLTSRAAELAEHVASLDVRLGSLAEQVARRREEIAHEIEAAGSLLEETELPDVLADEGSPANPVAVLEGALRDRARSIDALLEAENDVRAATRSVTDRQAELVRVTTENGFEDVAGARAARLAGDEITELERRIAQHEAAVARVEAGLAEPQVADLAEDVLADVPTARTAVQRAEAETTGLARQHEYASRRAASAAQACTGIERAITAWEAARAQAAPVTRMATLVSGAGSDNTKALSLATFVLVRRFGDVVAAANARLLEMSGGRYELVRSDEREDVRTRRTGLAMKVVDHRTEAARDPRTLSGGETFYVSLCLALGLADVVTAEAGGVELGTLFVDEGFGTLDPETLDAVLGELGKLRAGGRVVGVVSHVEALKQSIAERIEVRQLPSGASTLNVRA
ncbi:AAA family ATPase [Isoptericola croceus]|uniref:AAA family ATPase n=1 Tax=Isoptericola croceus TaxID=3031406 RepID=UPI0023F920AA|nr:AAA family ATPase [Isoptericola croceus]